VAVSDLRKHQTGPSVSGELLLLVLLVTALADTYLIRPARPQFSFVLNKAVAATRSARNREAFSTFRYPSQWFPSAKYQNNENFIAVMAPAEQAPRSTQYVFIESGPQAPDAQKTIRRHVMSDFTRRRRIRLQERLRPATSLSFSWKSSNLKTADDAISPEPWSTQGQDPAINESESKLDNDQQCETEVFRPDWSAAEFQVSNIADSSHAQEKATRLPGSKYVTRQILRTPRQRIAPSKAPEDQLPAFFQSSVVSGHGELSPCVCPTLDLVQSGDIEAVLDRGTPSYPQKTQSIYSAAGICRSCGGQLIWSEAAASSVGRQVSRFEANAPDPFAVYPIQKAPHMHRLIYHCE
jgi:hypothetical protein